VYLLTKGSGEVDDAEFCSSKGSSSKSIRLEKIQSQEQGQRQVSDDVVYVYQRHQSKFNKVERDGRDKPVFSIPIVELRVQNNSKRYVVLPISVYYKNTHTSIVLQ
jgi:hypothetical protein